ncbi:MAG TPA: aminotransferase class V-fold PLP-dependent enzyme [Rhabdochlamydiaceae bacterium]|nr:aminotransferase class V-fold PLP-dependent enzyme [Rhabdochlamydiaceae bacterium]
MIKSIHLNNHTTSRPFNSAIEKMISCFGVDCTEEVDVHVKLLREQFGAEEKDAFCFSSSGEDAISQVFLSTYMDFVRRTGKNHVLTPSMEESAIIDGLQRLEKIDCFHRILPVNSQGQLTREILEEAIGPRTALVSLSWANGLTGVVHPITDLAQVCKEKGVLLHVDATYAIGKIYFRFQDLDVHFLTFDGCCLYAPSGTGGIFIRSGTEFTPLHESLNIPGLAALSSSIETISMNFDHVCMETARLRNKLEQGIKKGFPEAVVFFEHAERLPHCCAIGFPGVAHDALLYMLQRKGITATAGGGKFQQLSQVLTDCVVDPMLAQCALSFSLSYETTEEEIELAINAIVSSAHKLRSISSKIMECIL